MSYENLPINKTKKTKNMSNTKTKHNTFLIELKNYSDLKDLLKERCRVFQVDSKEQVATAYNKPIDYFYDWSHKNWSRVSRNYTKRMNQAFDMCRKAGIPDKMPFSQFPLFQKLMKFR